MAELPTVEIVEFEPRFAPAFAALNLAWIHEHFWVEPADEAVLADPQVHVIGQGGRILFVLEEGRAVGTCALLPHKSGEVELAKMAVDVTRRGKGYGRVLMKAALEAAREMGARRVILFTSTKLPTAIGLYERFGFRSIPVPPESKHERADHAMVAEMPA